MTDSFRDEAARTSSPSDRQDWVLRSRALLEQSAQQLDGATLSRLNRARQAALDGLEPRRRERASLRWAGAVAVSIGVALVLWRGLMPMIPTAPPRIEPLAQVVAPAAASPTPVATSDFELLADAEQYVLLQDLEFYAWLETAEDPGG